VKAGAGALEAASIVAPAMAAIAPRDRIRKFMLSSRFPTAMELWSNRLNLA
jgi:hypothetical protein